jgi:hypothetical protein
MKTTKLLSALAVIGVILSVALLGWAGTAWAHSLFASKDPDAEYARAREAMIRRIPESDIRADFEVLSSLSQVYTPHAYGERLMLLGSVFKRYPDSVRLQMRTGMYAEGPQSVAALNRVAQLDPDNALPLYYLASKAAEENRMGEAVKDLRLGNSRRSCTDYPIPNKFLSSANPDEYIFEDSVIRCGTLANGTALRSLVREMRKYAMTLHHQERDKEALGLLSDTRKANRAVFKGSGMSGSDLIDAASLNSWIVVSERRIYQDTGSQSGLSQVAKGQAEDDRLLAGVMMSVGQGMDNLMQRESEFFSPTVPLLPLGLEIVLMPIIGIIWVVLSRRSKGLAGSDAHITAEEDVFNARRLLDMYAIIFLPLGLVMAVVTYKLFESVSAFDFLVILPFGLVSPIALWIYSARAYKRAYRAALEQFGAPVPRLWKEAPVQDKREAARRMLGVHGGAVVFLVVLGLLISVGEKAVVGAFPWQTMFIMEDMRQRETLFVDQLVQGKIKVPESYIRAQVETRQANEKKRLEREAKQGK